MRHERERTKIDWGSWSLLDEDFSAVVLGVPCSIKCHRDGAQLYNKRGQRLRWLEQKLEASPEDLWIVEGHCILFGELRHG